MQRLQVDELRQIDLCDLVVVDRDRAQLIVLFDVAERSKRVVARIDDLQRLYVVGDELADLVVPVEALGAFTLIVSGS